MSVDLTLLHPDLVAKIGRILEAMKQNGTPMRICSGRRSTSEQMALWAQGRTVKGPVVTYIDGLHVKSKHQLGEAVDVCFLGDDPFGESQPWGYFGDLVRGEGLFWGGDFRPHTDRPHVELRTPIVKVEVA